MFSTWFKVAATQWPAYFSFLISKFTQMAYSNYDNTVKFRGPQKVFDLQTRVFGDFHCNVETLEAISDTLQPLHTGKTQHVQSYCKDAKKTVKLQIKKIV